MLRVLAGCQAALVAAKSKSIPALERIAFLALSLKARSRKWGEPLPFLLRGEPLAIFRRQSRGLRAASTHASVNLCSLERVSRCEPRKTGSGRPSVRFRCKPIVSPAAAARSAAETTPR